MTAIFPTVAAPAPMRSRKHLIVASHLAFIALGLMAAALGQLAALAPGVKALVGFVGFVVAFISLAALRNFGPVLFYLGMAIFGAVGLTIAGAILGAVI